MDNAVVDRSTTQIRFDKSLKKQVKSEAVRAEMPMCDWVQLALRYVLAQGWTPQEKQRP
jgi:hypothetical protein